MNRLVSIRVGAVFASVAMALAGCNCEPVDDCTELAIDTVPVNDAVDVTQTADVVATLRRGATPVAVATAKLSFRNASDTTFSAERDGTVADTQATFAGVDFAKGGETFLKVTLAEKNSTCALTKDVRITVKATPMTPPVLSAIEFPQDSQGTPNGILNAAELPIGTALQVRVRTTTGTGAGAKATLRDLLTGAQFGGEVDIVGEVATFTVPAPVGDVISYNFQANATRGSVSATAITKTLDIRRTTPLCANTSPDLVGPNSDADSMTAGFQVGLLGTVGASVTSARFELSPGNLAATATVTTGMAAGVVTIPQTGDVTYSSTLIATDAVGNECRATKNIRANFQGPRLTFTSPVSTDGGTVEITQTPQRVTIAAAGLEDGRQVCVTARLGTAMPTQVGCGNAANGVATFDLNLTADGLTTFTATATDSLGNSGTASFPASVTLDGCVPAFDAALACPNTYLTSSHVSGGQFAFTGSARTRCAGQAARLFLGTSTSPAASSTVGATGTVAFTPVALTSGTIDARIEVDRPGVGAPYTVTCSGIVVDLTPPTLTNPAIPTTPPFVLNTLQDLQPAVPGAQRALGFSGVIPTNGTAHACMSQAAGSSGTACPGNTGYFLMNPAAGIGASPVQGFTFPEGEYQVRIVLRRGNGINSSASVPVRVDVTPPCVAMNGFTFPQDTAPTGGDGRLSMAELNGGNPRVAVQLDPSCADPAGAPATTIAVRELNSGTPGTIRATGTATTTSTVLTFSQAVGTVQNLTLFLEATDWVGNRNSPTGAANTAVKAIGIYPVLPACQLDSPATNGRLNGVAVASGIFVQATTSAAGVVGANGVQFSLTRGANSPVTQTVTPAATGQATSTFSSQDGSYSLSAQCTDLAGNQRTTSSVGFEVDATPPQGCAVTSPTTGATTITNQVATTITTTAAETNSTVRVASSIPAPNTEVGTFALTGTSATSTLTYSLGNQNLSVTVTDDFGNACAVAINNVNVTSTTCVFSVTKGFVNGQTWLNKSAQTDTSITINSSNCRGQSATLVRTIPAATFTATTDVGTGDAVFAVTPVNGDVFTITVGTSAPTTVAVDFIDPVVPVGAFTVAGAAPNVGDLKIVAPVGNPRIAGGPLATPGYYPDTNPGVSGGQVQFAINGITGGRQAGVNGRVDVLVGGSPVLSNSSDVIDADPKNINFGSAPVGFTHPTPSSPLVVRVSDQAGNAVNAFSGNVTVDVVAPADPQPSITSANRSGTLTLAWGSVGDDDTTGVVQGYQTRWTTRRVAGANALLDEAEFFSTSRTFTDLSSDAGVVGRTLRVPPLNEVIVAVRAYDDVDNFSLTSTSGYPAPLTRDLSWSVTTIVGTASTAFGRTVDGQGDVNGDGIKDLIIAAPTTATSAGSVFIYNGDGGVVSQAGCNTGCQALTPFDSATGQFGIDVSTAGTLDESGSELVVAQSRWSANTGRVFVYFNSTNGGAIDPAQRIEIRGDAASTFFGESARIIKSIDGDQFDELAISTPTWPANAPVTTDRSVGRVYLFRGRARASWAPLFGTVIALSDADWVLNGPTPRNGTGNAYGQARSGIASMGSVEGNAVFTIPMSRQSISQAQLWRSSLFTPPPAVAAATIELGSTVPSTIQGPVNSNTAATGFAQSTVGGLNIYDAVAGAPFLDAIYSNPINGQVFIYPDLRLGSGSTVTTGSPITISGSNLFGYALSVADVNADGALDIIAVEGGGQVATSYAWVLFQRDAAAYRTNPGTNPLFEPPSANSFWVARLPGPNVALDTYLTVQDVTGDGLVDIVFSDQIAASGPPEVRIHR